MPPKEKKLAGVSKVVLAAVWLCIGAATLYSAFTYSGIFKVLSDLQLKFFNRYFPDLTFAFMLLVHLGIAIVALYLLSLFGIMRYEDGEPYKIKFNNPNGKRGEALQLWIDKWRGALTFLGVGVVFLCMGLYEFGLGMTAGELKEMSFEEIQPYAFYNKQWVKITGIPVPDASVGSGKADAKKLNFFIPLVKRGSRGPVTVFIKWYTEDPTKMGNQEATFEGLLSYHGIPGIVRTRFEEMKLPMNSGPAILEWKKTPKDLTKTGGILALIGGIFTIVGTVIVVVKRKRQLSNPPQESQPLKKAA